MRMIAHPLSWWHGLELLSDEHSLPPRHLGGLSLRLVDLIDVLHVLDGQLLIVSNASEGDEEVGGQPESPVVP